MKFETCSIDAGLIELVCQQLTAEPCQSFRRPTAPTDSLIADIPAIAAFSKAALDGGIEHESVQSLYQVVHLFLVSFILITLVSHAHYITLYSSTL